MDEDTVTESMSVSIQDQGSIVSTSENISEAKHEDQIPDLEEVFPDETSNKNEDGTKADEPPLLGTENVAPELKSQEKDTSLTSSENPEKKTFITEVDKESDILPSKVPLIAPVNHKESSGLFSSQKDIPAWRSQRFMIEEINEGKLEDSFNSLCGIVPSLVKIFHR